MLGETVLQLAVAKWPSTRKHESLLDDLRFNEERKVFTSTFFAGVTIALCQMHVHLCSAPGDDEKHALGAYFVGAVKARQAGMVMVFLYASIFSFKVPAPRHAHMQLVPLCPRSDIRPPLPRPSA